MGKEKTKFKGIIHKEIIDALKNDKCILFVGSGLSSRVRRSNGSPLPRWNDFLIELLEWANNHPIECAGLDYSNTGEIIAKGNYLMAAQELQDKLNGPLFGNFLKEMFDDKSVLPSDVHKILPLIPFRAVLTTNYDSLIEGAYTIKNNGKIPPVLVQEDLPENHSPLRSDKFFILKLHGTYEKPSTVILGSRDYQDLLFRTPGYRHFLETLFSTHTIIFIGFSGSDPDLDNVLNKLSSLYSRTLGYHYILLPENTMNITEKRRMALDKKLVVIEYSVDETHSQIDEFLKEMCIQSKSEEIKPYPDVEREKLKIFINGSSEDIEFLKKIAAILREYGHSPWLAEEQTEADNIFQRISEAIDSSDVMIVVVSKNSINSKWVKDEREYAMVRALDGKMIIIPIIIGDTEIPPYLKDKFLCIKIDENFDNTYLESLLSSVLMKIRK